MTDRAGFINSPITRTTSNAMAQAGQKPTNTFMRAVVVELLNDPSYYTDEELIGIFNNLANPKILTGNPQIPPFSEEDGDPPGNLRYLIPRNSLLVNFVNAGKASSESKLTLCFPFFPPYMQFPVKPGEQIWVMSERPTQETTYLYWMCRITAPGFTDDVNYTHIDRQILPTPEEDPQFPNGAGAAGLFTIPPKDTFDTIVDNSSSGLSFTAEPVPRLTRRPGDLVLQGSNNTLILMSDDRGWGADENPAGSETSNASKTEAEIVRTLAGSIDVVAGRGRFLGSADEEPGLTAPRVIANTRDNEETDKYFTNPVEGDPDFVNDSSRIYVSMNTDGDEKLGLEYPAIDGIAIDAVNSSPYVIIKSDEIRIAARKNDNEGINGSIKIVKEGEEGEDKAVIVIQPDGSILISGPRVSIGTGDTDDNQVLIGNDSSADHLVMGETLQGLLEETLDAITQITVPTGVGPSGPPVNAAAFTSIRSKLSTMLSKVGRTK